jgi:hypothetical protein
MPEVLRYPDRVKKVEEHFRSEHVSGSGDSTVTRNISEGWFLTLESGLILPCGAGKPEFEPGDICRHTIENLAHRPPTLDQLLAKAKDLYNKMTPEERKEMVRKQGEGWARSEAQWARDFAAGLTERD